MTTLADPVDSPASPSAARPTVERTGPVTISRELFDFLMGVGDIAGLHFGEEQPDKIGAFWWRRNLRDADSGLLAEVDDIVTAIEPVRHWYDSVDHEPRPLVDVVTDMVFDIKADRQVLTSMHAALRAQEEAERRGEACDYRARGVECFDCNQRFRDAAELRRAAFSALDGDASRYLAMLDLAEPETSH